VKILASQPARATESTRLVWLGSAMLLAIGRFYPFDRFPLVTCPLKAMTGIPCPGCGMTRAFVRFTHGDWAGSIHVSPLGAALAATAALATAYGLLRMTVLRRGLALELTPRESRVSSLVLLGALLVNWVYLIASGAAA